MERIKDFQDYKNRYEKSLSNNEDYWASVANEYAWFEKWKNVHSGNLEDVNIKWFEAGKTNITYNCLDRHLDSLGDKTALIYEFNNPKTPASHISYKELHQKVCQFSNVLKEAGIQKGDRVCFYMGMTPELLYGVLACARIGAVHCVVFGGFSANALAGRIQNCEAKILVTHDGSLRGEKIVPLKDIADEALKECPSIEKVLVSFRALNSVQMDAKRDLNLDEILKSASSECAPEKMDAEDPLFILHTSGSTGKPKGLTHTTGGYMVYAGETFKQVFGAGPGDVYWCSADIGWITGHTYITYGPLLNGTTTVMFEGVPTYPDPGRFWEIIDKLKVTHFYTAPTAIRALEAKDIKYVQKNDLSSLRVLGSVGEPINEEAWQWYYKNIGKENCPIVDTWWQTETGGIMISPLAHVTEMLPCFATDPLPGIEPVLMDDKGQEITETQAQGNLCIKRSWPGMARSIWGDHERYKQTYFSTYKGYYFTGDGAKRDKKGRYRITGRVDDVINVSGHRIGTAEVEDAINEHSAVIESAVVAFPHKIKGQGTFAFVIADKAQNMDEEIRELVAKEIGPIAKPDEILLAPGLPKTRSGKIMRRILRKIAAHEFDQLGDTTTLLNSEVVEQIVESYKKAKKL